MAGTSQLALAFNALPSNWTGTNNLGLKSFCQFPRYTAGTCSLLVIGQAGRQVQRHGRADPDKRRFVRSAHPAPCRRLPLGLAGGFGHHRAFPGGCLPVPGLPRDRPAVLGLLLLSLAPVFGAVIAWIFFGQTLNLLQIAGIVVTLAGISWVIMSRPQAGDENTQKGTGRGLLFGTLAALGQATGLVLSQQGMTGSFSPFAGTLIRMLVAFGTLWKLAAFQRQAVTTVTAMRRSPRRSAGSPSARCSGRSSASRRRCWPSSISRSAWPAR